jgi:hypothetical protein
MRERVAVRERERCRESVTHFHAVHINERYILNDDRGVISNCVAQLLIENNVLLLMGVIRLPHKCVCVFIMRKKVLIHKIKINFIIKVRCEYFGVG